MTKDTNLPKIITAKNLPETIISKIRVRDHEILIDEEPLYGGNDTAPDPFDYVLAGVAGCSAISIRQFAERKDWPLNEIEITLTYDSINGEHVVTKEITLAGDLTEDQRKVLLRVAHCPTEKMLETGMKFTSKIMK